jgi:hypothetical protein
MVVFITNEETHRSVKSVTRHFSRLGWRVTETGRNNESLLQAAKRDILLFIKCVDTDIQRFLPVYEFIERIESFGRECRSRSGEGIVFVVNRPLNGLAAEALLSKGIALFALTDLDVLTNLELLYQHIPASLSVNERLIVRGCKSFCIAMSEAALKKDEISEARTTFKTCRCANVGRKLRCSKGTCCARSVGIAVQPQSATKASKH